MWIGGSTSGKAGWWVSRDADMDRWSGRRKTPADKTVQSGGRMTTLDGIARRELTDYVGYWKEFSRAFILFSWPYSH